MTTAEASPPVAEEMYRLYVDIYGEPGPETPTTIYRLKPKDIAAASIDIWRERDAGPEPDEPGWCVVVDSCQPHERWLVEAIHEGRAECPGCHDRHQQRRHCLYCGRPVGGRGFRGEVREVQNWDYDISHSAPPDPKPAKTTRKVRRSKARTQEAA